MNTYDVGSLVRVQGPKNPDGTIAAIFTDINGAAADPATVTLAFVVLDQLGQVKTATVTWTYLGAGSIVKDGVGKYHADLDTTAKPGVWDYRWAGTGAGQSAGDGKFLVLDTPAR